MEVLAGQLHLGELCLLPGSDMVSPARIVAFGPAFGGGRDIYVVGAAGDVRAVARYWRADDAVVLRWPETFDLQSAQGVHDRSDGVSPTESSE
jgi:hypothetical protein